MLIRKIRQGMHKVHKRLAAVSIVSLGIAVWITELCSSPDYSIAPPSDAILLEIEHGDGRACPSAWGNPLKILQTVLTLALLHYIARKYVFR